MKFLFFVSLLFITVYAKEAPSANEKECFSTDDIYNFETKKSMQDWQNSIFGLQPHHPNYILPFGIANGKYYEYTASDKYQNIEAQLQVSLKWNFYNNLFRLHESYNLAYTHTAFWQIYSSSSPFRETNYNPEFFVTFPVEDDSFLNLHSVTFGLAHLSNGQGNIEDAVIPESIKASVQKTLYFTNRSRSINYMYVDANMQYDNLIFTTRLWVPYFGADLDDNPDIIDYTGFTNFGVKYFFGKSLIAADTRVNFWTQKGSLKVAYSYPIYNGIFFYTKFFTGYGESLIDYNNYITKLSIGFSFSR